MFEFPPSLQKLLGELQKLPGVGPKSAQRLAFYLLKKPRQEPLSLASSIQEAVAKIRRCSRCFNLTDSDTCSLCNDSARDGSLICVVEQVSDLMAMERTGQYHGLYHVLEGALSPMEGKGPDEIRISELLKRLQKSKFKEVILAMNPDVEGEATALYLMKQLKPLGVKVTRLAYGLPAGGNLEYADEVTLMRSLEGRREV